jgi:hypothetical protein
MGAGITYFNYGSAEKLADAGGVPESLGTFYPFALAGYVGFGQWLEQNWALGGTLKLFYQNIDSAVMSAIAGDFGLLYRGAWPGLQLGLACQNLGFSQAGFNLPSRINLGAAYRLPWRVDEQDIWDLLADFHLATADGNATSAHIGSEYFFNGLGKFRLGYSFTPFGLDQNLTGLSCGLGTAWRLEKGIDLALDYTLLGYLELGILHQLMASLKF